MYLASRNHDEKSIPDSRSCLSANCLNTTNATASTSFLGPRNSTNTTVLVNLPLSSTINKTGVGDSANPLPFANTTTTTIDRGNNRLGWIIGLVSALALCFILIGIAIRVKFVEIRRMRNRRELVICNKPEDKHQEEKEIQHVKPTIKSKLYSFKKSQPEKSLSVAEYPDNNKRLQQEILSPENCSQKSSSKGKDEGDERLRKSSFMGRLSLRQFVLKSPVDMLIFQARTDAPLDTFQLEIKHRERLSKPTKNSATTSI